jgi:hypothetical protein
MSLYPPPATIKAEVFTRMPEHLRKRVRTAWADFNKAGQIADCFLEGPSFDRQGKPPTNKPSLSSTPRGSERYRSRTTSLGKSRPRTERPSVLWAMVSANPGQRSC